MKKNLYSLIYKIFFGLGSLILFWPSRILAQRPDCGDTGALAVYQRIAELLRNGENFTADNLKCFIADIAQLLFFFGILIALVWIVVSGIQYALASGDPQKTVQAKQALIWAVIGLIVCFAAWLIIEALQSWL